MTLNIVIMGVQGAGKGEQAKYMKEKYGIPHISTGDLFRAMRSREDALARRIQDIMKQGKLVSDKETNEVLLDRFKQPDTNKGFILDGYPRNVFQAQWLDSYLEQNRKQISAVILLELDPYIAFKRSYGRVAAAKTGKTYNIYYNNQGIKYSFIDYPHGAFFPPRLEAIEVETNEPLIRRADDAHAASVVQRIDDYIQETRPLIEYFAKKGVLRTIPADQSIGQVRLEILNAIEDSLSKKGS